jgi:hypothetical protein
MLIKRSAKMPDPPPEENEPSPEEPKDREARLMSLTWPSAESGMSSMKMILVKLFIGFGGYLFKQQF